MGNEKENSSSAAGVPVWIKALSAMDPAKAPEGVMVEVETAVGNFLVTAAAYSGVTAVIAGPIGWSMPAFSILFVLAALGVAIALVLFFMRMLIDARYFLDVKKRVIYYRINLAGIGIKNRRIAAFNEVEELGLEEAADGTAKLYFFNFSMKAGGAFRQELFAVSVNLEKMSECARKVADIIGCKCKVPVPVSEDKIKPEISPEEEL